ncbi:MAG: lysophospholipase [Eubacteriales bacterium]|jgi:alpha-beta hydrolase superfamily lysophospholipase
MLEFELKHDYVEYQGYYSKAEKPLGAIAVLHGIGEHFGRYSKFADYIAQRGYSVYGIDLPGHGKSPGIRGQIGKRDEFYGLVDTLLNYIRQEEPGVPRYLMGHSMGGNLALSYRLAREKEEVRGYIITSPWIRLVNMPTAIAYFISIVASVITPNLLLNNRVKSDKHFDPSELVPPGSVPDKLCHPFITPGTAAGCFKWAKLILKNADIKRGPVLLMHGTKDGICSIEGSRAFAEAAGKLCTYREWEGLRHDLHNEVCWQDIANEILVWLETQRLSR